MSDPGMPSPPSYGVPPRIEIGGAFSYGWRKLFENPGPWLLAALATLAANGVLNFVGRSIGFGPFGGGLLNLLVSSLIGFVLTAMALEAVRGEKVGFPDLDGRFGHIIAYVVAGVLYGLGVAIGLVFFIVPGIMFAVAFFYFSFVIVDSGADPFKALGRSREITRGNRWSLFGAGLLAILVMMAGALAFGIGLLFAIPINAIAAGHIYQQLQRRPIAP